MKVHKVKNILYDIFENSTDFGFKGQIERASVSIMNNIAEGYERRSNKEFKQFLFSAKGSCGEVRSMLHLVKHLNKSSDEVFKDLYYLSVEISKLLSGLIKTL